MLGFRDQTLPARRCALADSGEAFATIDGEGHDAQLAVLEVIGDSLQIVEDVGVMADASSMVTGRSRSTYARPFMTLRT